MSFGRRSLLPLLPTLVLLALPVFVLNLGGLRLAERTVRQQRQRQEDRAEQILASLSSSWEASTQLNLIAGAFRQRLEDLYREDLPAGKRMSLIKTLKGTAFRPPFPSHRLVVMEFDPEDPTEMPRMIVSPEGETISKRPFCLALRHLARNALAREESPQDFKIGQKMVQALFGSKMISEILFQHQVGRASPAIYGHQRHLLLWDYVTDRQGHPAAGFFLLVPNDAQADRAAFSLGLRNAPFREPRGYIRFLPSRFGHVLRASWRSHPGFRSWLNWFLASQKYYTLERKPGLIMSFPLSTGTLYARIMPGSTHLAVTLLPVIPPARQIGWIVMADFFLFLGLALLLCRGFLRDECPQFSLQTRFIGFFALAAAFPLGTVGVLAGLLLEEKRDALLLDLQRKLKGELLTIDLGEDKRQADLLRIFHQILQDRKILAALKTTGLRDPKLLDLARGHFAHLGPSFPIPLIALYDLKGNDLVRSGTHLHERACTGILKFFRSAIVYALWKISQAKLPPHLKTPNPLTTEEMLFLEAYEGGSGIPIENMFAEFRETITNYNIDREFYSKLHQYFVIEGVDQFAIMLVWRNSDFIADSLEEAFGEFLGRFPDGSFMAFKRHRSQLEPLMRETRHARQLARLVNAQGENSSEFFEHDERRGTLSLIVPSRRHADRLYSCSVSTSGIEGAVTALGRQYAAALCLWLLSTAGLLLFSIRRIINPIRQLTGALREVSRGNLDIHLKMQRRDELGELSDTFDAMIAGLQNRRRLSTIVSQKAKDDLFPGAVGTAIQGEAYRTEAVTLVSDIRGFTTICESRPTREVTTLLNRHFEAMAAVITRHRGQVDKFIGDAIQAIFVSEPREDANGAVDRAMAAGMAMLQCLEELNRQRIRDGSFPYAIGVGLATGSVLVGGFGDRTLRYDYSVMGTPMKEAAHLEGLSKKVPYFPMVVSPLVGERWPPGPARLHPLPGHEAEARVFSLSTAPAAMDAEAALRGPDAAVPGVGSEPSSFPTEGKKA